MELSSFQDSKTPSVSKGETGLRGEGVVHRERWISKPPEGKGNCDESLGKLHQTKILLSGCLQSQAAGVNHQ